MHLAAICCRLAPCAVTVPGPAGCCRPSATRTSISGAGANASRPRAKPRLASIRARPLRRSTATSSCIAATFVTNSRTTAPLVAAAQLLTPPHIWWLPNRRSLAEATVASFGLTERHALGCLRLGCAWRGPARFTGRSEEQKVLCARRAVRLATPHQTAGGSANPQISPSVLLSFL
jgi:hypothetical protein